MEPVTASAAQVDWFRVDDPSAPGTIRRAAMRLAEQLGFAEHRAGEVGIAATELATNLSRHAVAGTLALRVRRHEEEVAVELISIDAGPGIADLDAMLVDGRSTDGTLGIGLGAVRRLASRFDAHSVTGRGTVIVATFWAHDVPPPDPPVAAFTRAITGEEVCGDACCYRVDRDRTILMVADGLGHGPLAAAASTEAVRAFAQASGGPAEILAVLHARLATTRGAAVAVAELDPKARCLRFAGVGNVAGWVDDGDRRRGLLSHPGIVGHQARSWKEVTADLPPASLVVLHSDGLTDKWNLAHYPGLRRHDVAVVAATLLRDAGIRHDDASVLVARATEGHEE